MRYGVRATVGLQRAAAVLAVVVLTGTGLGLARTPLDGVSAAVLALVVSGCIALGLRVISSSRAESRLFALLADAHQRAGGGSADLAAQALVTAAARVFAATEAEIVLLGAEGPVRYAGDGRAASRRRVDADAFDQPWVLQALGTGGTRTGRTEGSPYCSAVVGSFAEPGSPLAVLAVRRSRGSAGFSRGECRLVRLLVRQAARWLAADGPAAMAGAFGRGGAVEAAQAADPAAYCGPDLGVLRDSARRLSVLAGGPGGPGSVQQIVAELHAVEGAVASLLGTLAMTSARQLTDRVEAAHAETTPASQAAGEWTTTGLLAPVRALP